MGSYDRRFVESLGHGMISFAKLAVEVAEDYWNGPAGCVLDDVVDELVNLRKKSLVVTGF
jgi:hypothetical protein